MESKRLTTALDRGDTLESKLLEEGQTSRIESNWPKATRGSLHRIYLHPQDQPCLLPEVANSIRAAIFDVLPGHIMIVLCNCGDKHPAAFVQDQPIDIVIEFWLSTLSWKRNISHQLFVLLLSGALGPLHPGWGRLT
ncbi:hypothetical protein CLAIMM_07036 [Cladophialophora immunda]|nr:hypothetical protein CLAIMM_07036 [Cladophialophora immunda]